jgi:hypothetical protein
MRPWLVTAAIGSAAVCVSGGANAADLAVGVGVVEAVAPVPAPALLGMYSCAAVSLVVPAASVFLVPTVGIEWSPELGAWGFSGGLAIDVPVANRVGVDIIASVVHDQAGAAWSEAAFYAGLGAGVSVSRGAWTLSPSVVAFHGINVGGWTLSPGLALSRGF